MAAHSRADSPHTRQFASGPHYPIAGSREPHKLGQRRTTLDAHEEDTRVTYLPPDQLPLPPRTGELVPPTSEARTAADRASIGREFELATGTEKDHDAIYRFLLTVFQQPTLVQYQHAIEAPRYEPLDRLIFRCQRPNGSSEIAAHVQLRHQALQFGEMAIPTIDIRHLGTLPEYRSRGLASRLLQAVEHDTNLHGALIATVRTKKPDFFSNHGWVPWLSHCYSSASPRGLMSQLEDHQPVEATTDLHPRKPAALWIRFWRRNELDALRRLYAAESATRFGGLARDESDWQWLITGRGYDHIYVALSVDGNIPPDELSSDAIVGYAVVKNGRIVELMADRSTDAARQLLVRMSADSIEMGRHTVELDATPDSPHHLPFLGAGGRCVRRQSVEGRTLMAKILKPDELLKKLRPLLSARATQSQLPLGTVLGIQVAMRSFQLKVGRRQIAIVEGQFADGSIGLDAAGYASLLLGQQSLRRLIETGHAHVSSEEAFQTANALFPRLPTWRMPWEDLPARAAQ